MIHRVSKRRKSSGQMGRIRPPWDCMCGCEICKNDCLDWISLIAARVGAASSQLAML